MHHRALARALVGLCVHVSLQACSAFPVPVPYTMIINVLKVTKVGAALTAVTRRCPKHAGALHNLPLELTTSATKSSRALALLFLPAQLHSICRYTDDRPHPKFGRGYQGMRQPVHSHWPILPCRRGLEHQAKLPAAMIESQGSRSTQLLRFGDPPRRQNRAVTFRRSVRD